jgi:hypothetical protein
MIVDAIREFPSIFTSHHMVSSVEDLGTMVNPTINHVKMECTPIPTHVMGFWSCGSYHQSQVPYARPAQDDAPTRSSAAMLDFDMSLSPMEDDMKLVDQLSIQLFLPRPCPTPKEAQSQ